MKNSLVLLAVVLSVAAFAGMMRIKTDVQTMDRERMRLVRERAELRETKRVLEAEWALLASPDRLAKLVNTAKYVPASALDLMPLMPAVSLTTVPSPTGVTRPAVDPAPVEGGAIAAVEALMGTSATVVEDGDGAAALEEISGTAVAE